MGSKLTSGILGIGLVLGLAARVDAAPITWHWAGPVTSVGTNLGTVVPLGTTVDVLLTLDVDVPSYPWPSPSCLWGDASTSFQVLGQTYTNHGLVWLDAYGFGPGICAPIATGHHVEIVVPSWGFGGPELAPGWLPFRNDINFIPGFSWGGTLADGQPDTIFFPLFPRFDNVAAGVRAESFSVSSLTAVPAEAVPEPASLLLLGTGLAAVVARRRFKRRA